ncbi:uncharacterized protein LOC114865279 isoform X2 [Betta splendens]|uniref:Uncharacterized protein LOC114865279 isoform X2 n=1 Tax=Betta splendens TaxID=158456 RepID=A0A9W2XC68_BETSP|nr:uncharacterized protein LOC114865279 isoform X2 [Betta splendens]
MAADVDLQRRRRRHRRRRRRRRVWLLADSDIVETVVTSNMENKTEVHPQEQTWSLDEEPAKPAVRRTRQRNAVAMGKRGQKGKKRGQKDKRRGQEEKEGVTVKRTWTGGKRRWDKKHYCVFCRRPQVKIARHLLRKHADQQEVEAASSLPAGSKQRHLLLEHLRCRGNYLHNIEVIRQGSGEIVPCRQPSEEVDARSYLPCPLCLGFFLRADLWKHQASCRKKLASDMFSDPPSTVETPLDSIKYPISECTGLTACSPTEETTLKLTEDTLPDPSVDVVTYHAGATEAGSKQPVTSDLSGDLNVTSLPALDLPRKRTRVQAEASRLLPISSGASESCSEVLHRMNQDHVSYQVKSDWLICKFGNKLMGNQDGNQRRYDYVSQKLRELGRFLLAAKSLDSQIHNLQDVLAPGHLSLALAAARKASGYRWSRPPLAMKTTLKTVCEIAIGESLQDGDWEGAARTTDFYHMLGRDWDNLELLYPDPDKEAIVKKRLVQSRNEKFKDGGRDQSDPGPEGLCRSNDKRLTSRIPLETRLQTANPGLHTVLMAPKKVRRRPWSTAEKEAVWRQLGVHVLFQSVPGKEVCQRCLDLEPVLRGRHWKDIKNQVHNQIQSQKKQQFHAQVDLQANQEQQDKNQKQQQYQAPMDRQDKDHTQNRRKPQCHPQMDHHNQDNIEDQRKQQYHIQMEHQEQDLMQSQKKQQYLTRLDHQEEVQDHKKQLYPMDQPTQELQATLDRDTSLLTPYGPDGPHRVIGHPPVDRDPIISLYPLPQRTPAPHMDQLLGRTEWTDDSLAQNYPLSRHLARSLIQEVAPGSVLPNPHSGHVHF